MIQKKRRSYGGKNLYGQGRHPLSLTLRLVLAALSLAVVFSLVFFILRQKQDQKLLDRFATALADQRYEEAAVIYRGVQSRATSLSLQEKKRQFYHGLQLQMEGVVEKKVGGLLESILAGRGMTEDDARMVAALNEISAAKITPFLYRKTEELLDGKMDAAQWRGLILSFEKITNLRMIVAGLLEQEDALLRAVDAFSEAAKNEEGEDWERSWSGWQELAEDADSCRFAREYAGYRLKSYQEREFTRLLKHAQILLEKERYYSAKSLLEKMEEVFPDRTELQPPLKLARAKTPPSLERWRDMVEQISVKPLIAREELAFQLGAEPQYALNSLLSCSEFRRLLQELYERDYVLISLRQFRAWPQSEVEILVPTGKKPLLLVFDSWQYSVLNQLCGTAERLEIDAAGHLSAVAGELRGRDWDALPILEDFIAEHPDFSFDGARAVVALNGDENIFGALCYEEQNEATAAAWRRVGGKFNLLAAKDLELERAQASAVFTYLIKKGWDFASAGYQGLDAGTLGIDDLANEIDRWQTTFLGWIPETNCYEFPNGSHVYANAAALNLLLSRGYKIFGGVGPKVYNFYTQDYLHMDRTPINGFTLSSNAWNASRFCSPAVVLDLELRQKSH